MITERLIETLKRHEGIELKPYTDTVGKLTIGVGRNLDDVGIYESEAEMMLTHDLETCSDEIRGIFPSFDTLSELRQEVLMNMLFNLGATRLRGFRNMRAAIEAQDFERAAKEMLDSRWARQVGVRAQELARWMKTDVYE